MSASNESSSRSDPTKVSNLNVETNTTSCSGRKSVKVNEGVLFYELLVMNGSLENRAVRVLKDDECNTNVMSYEFFLLRMR